MIHLDTSFVIDFLREKAHEQPGAAGAWLEARPDESFGISVFVACELEAGAARAARPERERILIRSLTAVALTVFPDDRFAGVYADRLSKMQRRGQTIGTMDLLIATSAIVQDVPLLTANRRHFDVVPGLRVLSHR